VERAWPVGQELRLRLADGVYLQARLEDEAQCILVIIGATPEGKKELLGFVGGARESAHDWRALLLDLKRQGLSMAPKVAVTDRAWLLEGDQRGLAQDPWATMLGAKTANILNKRPKSQQPKAKRMLQDIWMAERGRTPRPRSTPSSRPMPSNTGRAPNAWKDRDSLLAFYDFPAEHWKHLRTSNPIESTFATFRHKTIRSKVYRDNLDGKAATVRMVILAVAAGVMIVAARR
jgi:putative transposase